MISPLKKKFSESELNEVFDNLLQQAMMMNDTKAGTLQILNKENNTLDLVAASGLSPEFIEHFKVVTIDDGSVCGRALDSGQTVFIADLSTDKAFKSHLNLALKNNILAVQSTPLITSNGRLIGMVSNHFRVSHQPSRIHLEEFEKFCRSAADRIEEYLED